MSKIELKTEPSLDGEVIEGPFYEAAKKVYPRHVSGFFRQVKWAVLVVALSVYYLLPFVRWNRGPDLPSQGVLVDLAHRRFYFFWIEIWPQEVYYFTGLLIIAGMTLFLMNALAGRVWCGYMCPQTVWTDLFMTVERWIEGDRRERMMRDAAPHGFDWWRLKAGKHAVWLFLAWWTGGAWVLYFADAPRLVVSLFTFQAPFVAYGAIGVLTLTTYVFAGFMREQVCLYMCPWPRIQAALIDEHALNVSYHYDRGEPRMSLKKAKAAEGHGEKVGDCIDCTYCVEVCPTGVDIRKGPSLGCIQCGLCIDACDSVMDKINRPTRLIAYNTDVNIKRHGEGLPPVYNLIRPRTVLYSVVIAFVGSVMLYALTSRTDAGLSALHDRNPLFTKLSDGTIRNGYELRIANKAPRTRRFWLELTGLGGRIEVVGASGGGRAPSFEVGPDQTREVRVLVSTPIAPAAASTPVTFQIVGSDDGVAAKAKDFFRSGGQ
jgi:cytochrome c oxidase accessory protein FixG